MGTECLYRGFSETATWVGSFEGDDLVGFFLLSFAVSVACAPLVLALYQRRVEQLMSARSPALPRTPQQGDCAPVRTHGCEGQNISGRLAANALFAASQARARALQRTLALSVGVFAVLVAMVITISPDAPGELSNRTLAEWVAKAIVFQMFVASLCLPMVLLGMSSTRFTRLFWTVFAPLFLATVALSLSLDDSMSTMGKLENFGGAVLLIVVLYAGIGGRRMRNVVPLLTLFACMLWSAIFAFIVWASVIVPCMDVESGVYYALIALALIIASVWALTRIAFIVLGWLTRAYERKVFSDSQFQVGVWMLAAALLFALSAGPDEAGLNVWSLGVLPALLGGLWVYRTRLKHIKPWQAPQRLLLLRVFADDTRGERLLDEVAFHWRFVGPIYMVGGPDLAKANLEPHELFLFLRRRLHDMFVPDQAALGRRLAAADERPDPDSRYRINEFFCFHDVWQQAVDDLLAFCRVVLLDLRGFNVRRRGTAFELTLLAKRNALGRAILLVDGKTDLRAVEQAVAEVPGVSILPDRILRTDGAVAGTDVLRGLFSTAAT